MARNIQPLILLIFLASTAHADEPPQASLFFTPEQTRTAQALAQKSIPAGQAEIRLGAVMYYGPEDWTLWLQGQRWTPDTIGENLHIEEVSEHQVRLSWRGEDDAKPRDIILRPNETYQIATGKITSPP